jgi:8-oxo-dGTP diphosphatase
VRELREELGITPTAWMFLETLHEPAAELTVYLYRVTAWVGTPTNLQPEEHTAIGWFTLAQTAQLELADPTYPTLFARYLNEDRL